MAEGRVMEPGAGAGAAVALGLLLALQIPIMPIVILGPNLPQLFRQFGALPQADLLVPLIMTAPSLGIALLAPVAGLIADRLGHRRLLVGGLALFALAGLLSLLLDRLPSIVAAQVVVGAGAAAIMTNGNALLGDYYPAEARNRWLGVQSMLGPFFSTAVGISAGLLGTAGWRPPFALNAIAVLAFAWVVLTTRRLRPGPSPTHRPARAAGVSAPAAPTVDRPWRRMLPVLGVTLLTALVFYVPTIHFSLMYQRLGVQSSAWIGVLITLGTVGSIGAGYLFRRRPAPPAWNLGLLFLAFAVSLAGFGLARHYLVGLASCIVANFAFGLTLPTLVGWALAVLPPAWRGRGMGLWMSAFFCAQFISPPLFALLMRAAGGLAPALLRVAGLCVLLAAAAFMVHRFRPQRSPSS
ncbi:MAG: MFS transporter [Gammaproteobacteria bacterium]|nr:MFS transporter [Gammaproteobacteria bacterium]